MSRIEPDVTIREAREADLDRIIELAHICLGDQIPKNRPHWAWKHFDNPFGASPCLLAESQGKLVGLRAFMRWTWQVGGRPVKAVRAVDTATHPDCRGKGIFSRLTRALLEQVRSDGVAFVFNTPNRLSMPGYLKMGWISTGKTSLWVRPVRPLRVLRAFLSRASVPPQGVEAEQRDGETSIGSPIESLLSASGIQSFVRKLPPAPGKLSTQYNLDYLRWRYASIPAFTYRAVWRFDEHHGALVIFRVKRHRAVTELRVCDALIGAHFGSMAIARGLVRSLANTDGADFSSVMAAPGTPVQQVFAECGYLPAPRIGPILTVRRINPTCVDPGNRSCWNCSIGDLEIF